MAGLSGWHLVILLVVVVLLFGAKRLPDMARAIGQSVRIFKGEMNTTAAQKHTPVPRPAPGTSPAVEQSPNSTSGLPTPPEQ